MKPLASYAAASALLFAVSAVLAQTPAGERVATLRVIEGNVLLSDATGLSSGEDAAPLLKGSRVITTANSQATVVYRDGCEVTLKANQRLEIDVDRPCKERIAQAQSIFLEPAGMALAAGGAAAGGGAAAAVLGGALAGTTGIVAGVAGVAGLGGLAALASGRGDSTVSPN